MNQSETKLEVFGIMQRHKKGFLPVFDKLEDRIQKL